MSGHLLHIWTCIQVLTGCSDASEYLSLYSNGDIQMCLWTLSSHLNMSKLLSGHTITYPHVWCHLDIQTSILALVSLAHTYPAPSECLDICLNSIEISRHMSGYPFTHLNTLPDILRCLDTSLNVQIPSKHMSRCSCTHLDTLPTS